MNLSNMNPYKLKSIVEFLRQEGKGLRLVTHKELLRCFALDELLPVDEQEQVQRELAAIAEAEIFMDTLRYRVDRLG